MERQAFWIGGNSITEMLWKPWVLTGSKCGWFWRAVRTENQDTTAVLNKWKLIARGLLPAPLPTQLLHLLSPTLAWPHSEPESMFSTTRKVEGKSILGPSHYHLPLERWLPTAHFKQRPIDVGNGSGAVTANVILPSGNCPEQAQSQRHKAAKLSSASAWSSVFNICRQ